MEENKSQKHFYNEFHKMIHSLNESLPETMQSFFKKTQKTSCVDLEDAIYQKDLSLYFNPKVIRILEKLNITSIDDINEINLKEIANLPKITSPVIDELLDLLTQNNSKIIEYSKTRLKDLDVPPALRRIFYKSGFYYLENLENIDLNNFMYTENCQTSVIDDLIDFLEINNINFVQKKHNLNLISKEPLSSNAKSVLYRSNLFYREDFAEIDLTKIFSTYNCGPAAVNDILSYIEQNNIECLQYKANYKKLSDFNLSYETLNILYKNKIYFYEDFASIKIEDINMFSGISPKIIDNILDFAFNHNFSNFEHLKDKKRIHELNLTSSVISALYKIGVYFTDDNIEIEDVIAANPNIAPKTISDITSYIKHKGIENSLSTKPKRIVWNEEQVALLIDTYFKIDQNEMTKQEGMSYLSNILRTQAIKDGIEIDEYYRNENGISMCLEHIRYLYSNNESGLKNISALEKEMVELQQNQPDIFQSILTTAKEKYGISFEKQEIEQSLCTEENGHNQNKSLNEEQVLSRISVEDCSFSVRVSNALRRNNIRTLYELKNTSKEKLMSLPNFGKGSLSEIEDFFIRCEQDRAFWISVLSMSQLPATISYEDIEFTSEKSKEIITELKEENTVQDIVSQEMPDTYFESILNIEGLSNKAIEIFKLNGVRKIGQLIQYSLESLFFENSEYKDMLDNLIKNDDCIISPEYKVFDEDIRIINNYLKSKGIDSYPIKISFENNKKLMFYTLEETQLYGWENIIFTLLNESFKQLKSNAKEIVFARNGIYCEPKTLEEIGSLYNVTRERIRQIESKSLSKITKYMNSCGYIDVINQMTKQLLEHVGAIYKIRNIEGMKNYLNLINKLGQEFDFMIDDEFFYVTSKENLHLELKERFIDELEKNQKISGSLNFFKDALCETLQAVINFETEFQKENFDSILEDIFQKFTSEYLIRIDDNDNYKIARNKVKSGSSKTRTGNRNEEIITLFSTLYPNGVHLPIDKDHILAVNLKPLIDMLPYKISIRTLSDGIIKNAKQVILWDRGIYRHVDTIQIQWSAVDNAIDEIISEFDNGNSIFSIKKIYDNNQELYLNAGIPNYTALLGLIKYRENPRIGNSKLDVFDIENEGDNINKTDIIEQYLLDAGDWVSTEDMQKHFCDDLGWENYQIDQYVYNTKNTRKDTRLGFIHFDILKKRINRDALQELLNQLYRQVQFTHKPMKLESLRRSSFSKTWVKVLEADVSGNFMSDFIDSLITKKGYPLLFYQGSAYSSDYKSDDLIACLNIDEVIKNYEEHNYNKLYTEFEFFDKELLDKIMRSHIKIANVLFDKNLQDMCDYFYSNNINNLGTLLFFPFNCIEFKKQFTDSQIKKTIKKVYSWVESFEDSQEEGNIVPDISSIFWRN